MAFSSQLQQQKSLIQSEEDNLNLNRYVPLDLVYSATSPSSYSNMSKKIKAQKFNQNDIVSFDPTKPKPPLIYFYSRSRSRRFDSGYDTFVSNLNNVSVVQVKSENAEFENNDDSVSVLVSCCNKKRKRSCQELVKLGIDLVSIDNDTPRLRESSRKATNFSNGGGGSGSGSRRKSKKNSLQKNGEGNLGNEIDGLNQSVSSASRAKRWVRYGFSIENFVCIFCLFDLLRNMYI